MLSLHDYQKKAIEWILSHKSSGVFADMGLGKTAIVLHAVKQLPQPVLIVGPIRVVEGVWAAEARVWGETKDLTFRLLRGAPKARKTALSGPPSSIYLVNPELLEEILTNPDRPAFGTLVVDESSMYKNATTQRFKVLKKHLDLFDRVVILTGTPTPNSLMDIWSQIYLLDKGERLGKNQFSFKSKYFEQKDYMGFVFEPRPGAMETVTDKVADLVMRIDAKDHLPERTVIHNQVTLELPSPVRKIYEDMKRQAFAKINTDSEISAVNAVAALMKLRQVASGFVYNDEGGVEHLHSEKIDALKEVIDETGSPIIVLYNFNHELEGLKKAFKHGVVFDSPLIEDWNKGKISLMFLHPASGGHGVNLQYGGHTMVIFSSSFSYEQMSQATARIDRQGQKHPVIFHSLIVRDSVDELIFETLLNKSHNQTSILKRIKEYASHNR
jgi:SNF2 family DNA or RNA helicase